MSVLGSLSFKVALYEGMFVFFLEEESSKS